MQVSNILLSQSSRCSVKVVNFAKDPCSTHHCMQRCYQLLLCLSVVNLIWTWVYPRSCWTQWWRKFLPLAIIRLYFCSHQWKQGCEIVWWRAPLIDCRFIDCYKEILGVREVPRSGARQAYFCWSVGSHQKKKSVLCRCILHTGIYCTEIWRYWVAFHRTMPCVRTGWGILVVRKCVQNSLWGTWALSVPWWTDLSRLRRRPNAIL